MLITDFKDFGKGSSYVKECIQNSKTGNYKDGYCFFFFSLTNSEIVSEDSSDKADYTVYIRVRDEDFKGVEDIAEFANSKETAEIFNGICEDLYNEVLKVISVEVG
jgi:hypothetical protein